MTASEWLKANGKRPFSPYPDDTDFYWGRLDADDVLPDDDDLDMLLPDILFDRMQGQPTYNDARRYRTLEEALADFAQAYEQIKEEVL